MKLLSVLVICSQLFHTTAAPPPTPPPITPVACEDVKEEADLALQKINRYREEGYVYAPYRISSAYKQSWRFGDTCYLTIDVLETNCHVLSKRNRTDCEIRPFHDAGYGQCKAIVQSRKRSGAHLRYYNCTTSRVPAKLVTSRCPHCPVETGITSSVVDSAKQMLQKYNMESNETNFFHLLEVTRASWQSSYGPTLYVEFTIHETNCSKNTPDIDFHSCDLLEEDPMHTGFCLGSVSHGRQDGNKSVSVSCQIYESQEEDTDESCHRRCGHGHKHEYHCGEGHYHPHGERHRHHHEKGHEHSHGEGHRHHHEKGHEHSHGEGHRHHHEKGCEHSHEEGREDPHRKGDRHSHGEGHEHPHGKGDGHSHGEGHEHPHGKGDGHPHGKEHEHPREKGRGCFHGEGHEHPHGKGDGHPHGKELEHPPEKGRGCPHGDGHEHPNGEGHEHGHGHGHHNGKHRGHRHGHKHGHRHKHHPHLFRPPGCRPFPPPPPPPPSPSDPESPLVEPNGPISNGHYIPEDLTPHFQDKPSTEECPGKPMQDMPEILLLFSDTPTAVSPK